MSEISDAALKSVRRTLLDVRAQRSVAPDKESPIALARRQGEIWGLDTALAAIERRLQ